MRDLLRKVNRSYWRDSIIWSPVLFILWLFLGWLFSLVFFDRTFATFKFISLRSDALTYVGLLFAVQIPVFILLLQRMSDLGYLRRIIMPGVIRFREILVSYILLSLLLLASKRASYYYFPVLALTLISLYTVFITVRVMFDTAKLKDRENNFVRRIIKQVFGDVLDRRKSSNDFFEELKNLDYVTHIFLDMGSKHTKMQTINIRSRRSGLIKNIYAARLNALVIQQFSEPIKEARVSSSESEETQPVDKSKLPVLIIEVRPGAVVKPQATLMKLFIPDNIKVPDSSFLNKLIGLIDIDTAIADSADKKLEELITDFKQQLRDAIDKDSVVQIQQSLDFYRLLLEGITELSHAVADSGYTFTDARQEFRQFLGDSVSEQIKSISEILNDEFLHSIKGEKQDTCREIIRFLYGELLNLTHDYDTVRAAFTDYSFIVTINEMIFDNSENMQTSFKAEVFKDLLFRYREHTGVLLYNYRNSENDPTIDKDQLGQWLEARIDDTRSFLLGTYKKSEELMFGQTLEVYNEFESDYRLRDENIKDLVLLVRCNLFVIAAYMHRHRSEYEHQKACHQLIDDVLGRLQPIELTQLLVKCIDNNYADKWRVDVYDLVADGQMHQVPDYSSELKTLWAEYMMKISGFPIDVSAYKLAPIDTTLTFSEGLPDGHDPYLISHLDTLVANNEPNSDRLLELVKKFIQTRKEWEENKLVNTSLSKTKVKEFREDVLRGYKDMAIAMKVFKLEKKLDYASRSTKSYLMLGWNRVNDKEAFIDDWHSGYIMRGEEQGNEIANRQNQLIAEKLFSNPITASGINVWLAHLLKSKDNTWVIFSVGVSPWYIRQEMGEYLVENTDYNDVLFKNIKQLPMQQIYDEVLQNGLYAVRTKHLGKLKVKSADNEPIEVLIDAYSHNSKLLDEMLNDPPQWLEAKGDRATQSRFLKTKVRMYIYHSFLYDKDSSAKTYYLPLSDR